MSASVKISVIIPIYNIKNYLSACLQSIISQTYADIEIIAVDDGSTDGSASVLEAYVCSGKRLRVITQENQGQSIAREVGTAAASGEYLLFVDGDDVIAPNYCAQLLQTATQEKADLVLSPVVRWQGIERPVCPDTMVWRKRLLRRTQTEQRAAVFEDFDAVMPLYGKLIARRLFDQTEERVVSQRNGEDISLSVQLLARAEKIALTQNTCYFYRQRPNSQSQRKEGRFEGLLKGFSRSRNLLKQQGAYNDVAAGFEYICRACVTSFMEEYGLNAYEEKVLFTARKELQVPLELFSVRSWKFRLRQRMLGYCLRYGFSYAKIWRFIHYFYGKGTFFLKCNKNQDKSCV